MSTDFFVDRVKRVRDADGALCLDCGYVVGRFWREGMVPWTWRRSQLMHEQGSGHKMQLFGRSENMNSSARWNQSPTLSGKGGQK